MSVIAGASGATLGAVRGVMYGGSGAPAYLAGELGRSWFMLALGFFTVREYAVLPFSRAYYPSIIGSRHTQNIVPSMLSGATVGALMAAVTGKRIVPGTSTIAVLCTGFQIAANELRILGRRISRKHSPQPSAVLAPSPDADPAQAASAAQAAVQTSITDPTTETTTPPTKEAKKSTLASLWAVIKRNSPIQSLSDDEYIQKLREREAEIVAELAKVEQKLSFYRSQLPK
ncbi:hypothetical protein MCUN1_000076 [Malassezia cuniculi]|uniref:Uncharacterized protein n=1 Tax=Malassezia cuniculi TaxID=948313 RepID=A0AAF0EV88_9BASI|nr:hypothetical protein MCUN1_000076 [Malassezia cuniculi]